MKIAMPKNGEMINQHFGKSESFIIVTVEDGKVVDKKEVSVNDLQHNHGGLSDLLIKEGASVVITGGIGKGAYDALRANNLEVIRGANMTIDEALESYLSSKLEDKEVMCSHHHGEHHHHHHHGDHKCH
ncbi:NifB/NifX family molybdenum-iron cluster-binding protein [Clostridium fallax]|uniref:Predicted Fe-Mo cluster-binding protein, NifX family n=1 Tax=Clostridium fallax TaxID=1533 RepID=A0A1M4VK13_9CLOT|nr:NifB/NifX family molybdenum-iron cluster-binding protein [Clostridium fallax]SHE69245.1 Predicted Fe-Mo cluster-binding protein, NifX family [Clostridium fallax]SQB22759.1 dinitrogenase iron-molybdenum cofactor family protein [Clostridium fallax]